MSVQRANKEGTKENLCFKSRGKQENIRTNTEKPNAGQTLEPLSNEELATLAQSGDRCAAGQLWEQVKRLAFLFAFRFFHAQRPACACCGVEIEDVQQEVFLAVMDAVEDFREAKGYRFNSYLHFHVKNRFNALIGRRGNRAPRPLDNAKSLDEAVAGEDNDLFLLDLVEDPEAVGAFEDAEEREYTRELHNALQKALDTLETQQAEVLRARYYDGLTLKGCAQREDVTPERIRQIEGKALRNMRGGERLRLLRPFHEEIITTRAYHGIGFGAWNRRGSSEEWLVEYIEDLEQRRQDHIEIRLR